MPRLEEQPITKAAFGGPDRKGPPPIEQEWRDLCEDDQDVIFFWGGEWNRSRPGGFQKYGWTWICSRLGADSDSDEQRHPATGTPAANVERMLSPLAHEARINIMQVLYSGAKSPGELSAATGLKGGNLYHHLKELLHAAYAKEEGGTYDLTPLGCQMLITVAAIAQKVVKDSDQEGLLVTSSWEE